MSFAKGDMLPIIFFLVFFGLSLAALPEKTKNPILTIFNGIAETMFKVTHIVMYYAPFGVFAFIAVTVATFG